VSTEPDVNAVEDETFRDEDWYAEEITGRTYIRCSFLGIDLTESVTRGAVFTDCSFGNVRFNASKHIDSAFTGCGFKRCNFFDVEFEGCKLVGSIFEECVIRPMRVLGGDWSFAGLPGADLRGSSFQDVRMREADLTGANCEDAVFLDVDLSGAQLHSSKFARTDLRGSDLSAVDPFNVELAGAIIGAGQAAVLAQALGLEVR
jgi:fluoroquinolone resistance protein